VESCNGRGCEVLIFMNSWRLRGISIRLNIFWEAHIKRPPLLGPLLPGNPLGFPMKS
jgi:hypothetical protein